MICMYDRFWPSCHTVNFYCSDFDHLVSDDGDDEGFDDDFDKIVNSSVKLKNLSFLIHRIVQHHLFFCTVIPSCSANFMRWHHITNHEGTCSEFSEQNLKCVCSHTTTLQTSYNMSIFYWSKKYNVYTWSDSSQVTGLCNTELMFQYWFLTYLIHYFSIL